MMNSSQLRKTVLVVESQPITAEGIRSLLRDSEDFEFTRSVDSLVAASDVVRALPPDVVLVDKSFGSQALVEWLTGVRVQQAGAQVVVWGTSIAEPEALRLLQVGVRGILRKTADAQTLLVCLRAVTAGANWMEESLFRESSRGERYGRSELTPREQQVLELVEQGLKNKEIARELGIRPGTVKIHLKHIFEKTGVRGRYGLALTGLKEKGMLELSPV
jgi:DNA-binding NarL/FixJ family response regulator